MPYVRPLVFIRRSVLKKERRRIANRMVSPRLFSFLTLKCRLVPVPYSNLMLYVYVARCRPSHPASPPPLFLHRGGVPEMYILIHFHDQKRENFQKKRGVVLYWSTFFCFFFCLCSLARTKHLHFALFPPFLSNSELPLLFSPPFPFIERTL